MDFTLCAIFRLRVRVSVRVSVTVSDYSLVATVPAHPLAGSSCLKVSAMAPLGYEGSRCLSLIDQIGYLCFNAPRGNIESAISMSATCRLSACELEHRNPLTCRETCDARLFSPSVGAGPGCEVPPPDCLFISFRSPSIRAPPTHLCL